MTLRMSTAAEAEVDGVSLDTITELDTKIQSLEQVENDANFYPIIAPMESILDHQSPESGAS